MNTQSRERGTVARPGRGRSPRLRAPLAARARRPSAGASARRGFVVRLHAPSPGCCDEGRGEPLGLPRDRLQPVGGARHLHRDAGERVVATVDFDSFRANQARQSRLQQRPPGARLPLRLPLPPG